MKKFIFIAVINLIAYNSTIFSQCTPNVVKIQTPLCQSPTELKTSVIGCSVLKMSWKGQKNESYILQVSYPDSLNSKVFETIVNSDSCDNSGNYNVIMNVNQGVIIDWEVQAICSVDSTTLFSNKLNGQKVEVPYCRGEIVLPDENVSIGQNVKIFPNPSTGYLNINYSNNKSEIIQFSVLDINGNIVLNKSISNAPQNGNTELDLKELAAGSYIITIRMAQNISQTKFVLFKK